MSGGRSRQTEGEREPLLTIERLSVAHRHGDGWQPAVEQADLRLGRGEIVGLVGRSGAGKSVLARTVLGIGLSQGSSRVSGEVRFDGAQLLGASEKELRQVRGARIAMIFQDPSASLNPVVKIGRQLAETIGVEGGLSRPATRKAAVSLLDRVGLDDPTVVADSFPHEISGGMQQKVMIALALVRGPDVLIADEPTTALDGPAAAEVLALLARLRDEDGLSVLLISHDLAVIRRMADRVTIMDRGRTMEEGTVESIFGHPEHEVTKRLLAASADRRGPSRLRPPPVPPATDGALLEVRDLVAVYPARAGNETPFNAVDGATLSVAAGETLALVGRSGCGKSTLARCVLRILRPAGGKVVFDGRDVTALNEKQLLDARAAMALVFQNPAASLNPRREALRTVEAPLRKNGSSRAENLARAEAALRRVGLDAGSFKRLPAELSGGQQQRVALARALVGEPSLLVCDEPFTSLDSWTRHQMVELLADLKESMGLACLFIAHDLTVVRQIADRIAVMDGGRIVETGPTEMIFAAPRHEQTRKLIDAMP